MSRRTTANLTSTVLSGGLRAAAVLAAATAVAPEARAEIAFANYIDESTFAFIVQDMPDFDQVRSVLPNTGNCYCGPTCSGTSRPTATATSNPASRWCRGSVRAATTRSPT
jgi:hypothetical protein